MKQSLQLRLNQQLTMTPQLQQAIRLLQLSNPELQQEIQKILDSNPMLEVKTEGEGEHSGNTTLKESVQDMVPINTVGPDAWHNSPPQRSGSFSPDHGFLQNYAEQHSLPFFHILC